MLRLALIGLIAGVFSALLGVGGGLIIVPLLILLARYPDRAAIGTSLAAIGITALAGTIRYAFAGDVEIAYAALVGVPSAFGAVVGASLQQRLNRNALRYAFAALLVVVAGFLLFK